jgi:phosphoribosylformimino-5-aminoimidazole carboxamide ribotide isomerase
MIVIPAIDVRAGRCVQAGEPAAHAAFFTSDDPVEIARHWDRLGFRRLHVMDRDGSARRAAPNDAVAELLADAPLVIQVGGAISSGDQVEQLVGDGAAFVVLGQRAIAEPDWLEGTASAFPQQLIAAARLHERMVDADGGARRRLVTDFVEGLASVPLAGLLLAPDLEADGVADDYLPILEDVVEASAHPVLVAGGFYTVAALRALQDRGVNGVIIGSALYSGQLDPRRIAEEFSE